MNHQSKLFAPVPENSLSRIINDLRRLGYSIETIRPGNKKTTLAISKKEEKRG